MKSGFLPVPLLGEDSTRVGLSPDTTGVFFGEDLIEVQLSSGAADEALL